jgi:hypothetical protein
MPCFETQHFEFRCGAVNRSVSLPMHEDSYTNEIILRRLTVPEWRFRVMTEEIEHYETLAPAIRGNCDSDV